MKDWDKYENQHSIEAPTKLNGRLKNLGHWQTLKKNKEFNIIDNHITRSSHETSFSIAIDINCKTIHFGSHKYVHLVSHSMIWYIMAICSDVPSYDYKMLQNFGTSKA